MACKWQKVLLGFCMNEDVEYFLVGIRSDEGSESIIETNGLVIIVEEEFKI